MIKSQSKIKELWNNLKKQVKSFDVTKTKFIKDELKINSKILLLLDKDGKIVSQLDDIGFIILDQTNFKSHSNRSISDQGIISNGYFKVQVLDVDKNSFNGVSVHLVSVITGIVNINDLELVSEVNEELHNNLWRNKLASKIFIGFLENNFNINLDDVVKTFISDKDFKVTLNKKIVLTQKNIFLLRNQINEFLKLTNINENKDHFIIKKFKQNLVKDFSLIEKIELKHMNREKESLTLTFLVGRNLINQYFDERKKEILFEINHLNKKIKHINHQDLNEFYPPVVVNSYEKLTILHRQYLKLKNNFAKFQISHHDVIENLINVLEGTQYSENLKDYEILHINFNHFLLNEKLLYQKADKILSEVNNKILLVSNSDNNNSFLIIIPTDDLKVVVNFKPLINQFLPLTIKKISYNDKSICIETDNYQVITDFISTMINFLKISNKKYE